MQYDHNYWPITVSVAEAAKRLSLGRTKIYELIGKGALKTLKVGRRTLVTMESIHALASRAN